MVDEDYLSYGFTSEIAAIVAEEALYELEAPIKRLTIPDVPIPYSRDLEKYVVPNAQKIADAVVKLMKE